MKNPKSILITGGSSGIGAALANEYAKADVTLFLTGRNEERLKSVKSDCEAFGAIVHTKVIDVADEDAMNDWIKECDEIEPLDLVIANAGISGSIKGNKKLSENTKEIFDVNVNGVFHTVHPVIELMKKRHKGQIAIVSSIAGYHGMPSAPSYSASKVAVKGYGEALRGVYHKRGIEINVICPGFVKSRITDKNDFPMPFFMEAPKAAKIIRRGLEKNKPRITFPWQTRLSMSFIVRFLPEFITERILRSMPEK